jgi:hypothetical protein
MMSDSSHEDSESDTKSTQSASSTLQRVGTSVENFLVGTSQPISPLGGRLMLCTA